MVTASSESRPCFSLPLRLERCSNRDKSQTWSATLRLFSYTDLNSVCYNSITEQGQMFWIAAVRGRYGSQFDVLSMLSISPGI